MQSQATTALGQIFCSVAQKTKQKRKLPAGATKNAAKLAEKTDSLKRDIKLLQLRSALDPGTHYRKLTINAQEAQAGTILPSPLHFYSDRAGKPSAAAGKKIKHTSIVDSLLKDEMLAKRLKKRYTKMQSERQHVPKSFLRKKQLAAAATVKAKKNKSNLSA